MLLLTKEVRYTIGEFCGYPHNLEMHFDVECADGSLQPIYRLEGHPLNTIGETLDEESGYGRTMWFIIRSRSAWETTYFTFHGCTRSDQYGTTIWYQPFYGKEIDVDRTFVSNWHRSVALGCTHGSIQQMNSGLYGWRKMIEYNQYKVSFEATLQEGDVG